MKKGIVLLLLVVVLTGCTVISTQTNDVDSVVNEILLKNNKLSNTFFEGYKYYVPKGLTFLEKDQFNAILQDEYQNRYYLYVDVVSYYHQIKEEYKEKDDVYYSKALKNDEKFGYLEINKVKGKYFIEAMYNYAKIEVYVEEHELMNALCYISSLLSSIKYNRSVLETLVGENLLNYEEEEFDIFKSKRDEGDFLDFVEEFGTYYDKNNELPDQDKIQIEEKK